MLYALVGHTRCLGPCSNFCLFLFLEGMKIQLIIYAIQIM